MKEPPYIPPTAEQAAAHWRSQKVSPQRTPHKRDPGLAVIPDTKALAGVIQGELAGNPQVLNRLRHPTDDTLPDALARAQGMIRRSIIESSQDFLKHCSQAEDLILYYVQYGDMKDAQRAQNVAKYAALVHAQQQASLKEHHQRERAAQRDTENQLAAMKLLRDLAPKAAKGPDVE